VISFVLSYKITIFLSLLFFLSSSTLVFVFDSCNPTPSSFELLTAAEVSQLFIVAFAASFNSTIFHVIIVPFEPILAF
jgi:hypothetical protein